MERLTVFDGEFWVHKNFPPVGEDTVDEFVDCVKELAARLAAYEDTGLEPEVVTAVKHSLMGKAIAEIKEFDGIPVDRLRELAQAEQDGRLVVLPCKDATVYTIKEDYFNCDGCEYKDNAHYQPEIRRTSCDMEDVHCPLYIEEHAVEGFEISFKDGNAVLSNPGQWGYEGLEHFLGIDDKWYLTREAAEAALAQKGGTHEANPV